MNLNEYLRFEDKNEKPLEKLLEGGGFSAIFRSIACIGDSLSSGELEAVHNDGTKSYHDYFEHSWGQYIARANGALVHNFSRGGMSAREYCESFAESKGFWNKELASQAYIFALGVNDVTQARAGAPDKPVYLGDPEKDIDLSDWHNNAKTFIGYYAQIIQRVREISPKCRIFLMTCPREGDRLPSWRNEAYDLHRDLLYKLAEMFEYTYVIDLREYGPVYDDDFHKHFFLSGHLNTMGYLLTARLVMTYIDYIIRHNTDDFMQAGFIGKGGIYNVDYKW